MSDAALEQVIALALELSMSEQARLLERVAANLAREVDETEPRVTVEIAWTEEELADLLKPGVPRTGAEIAAMIQSGEFDSASWAEMINPQITDPVAWVKALRRDMSKNR